MYTPDTSGVKWRNWNTLDRFKIIYHLNFMEFNMIHIVTVGGRLIVVNIY